MSAPVNGVRATVDTPGIATSNFTWSVSGSVVSNYVFGSGFSSAQVLSLTQTNKASISFYWVSGGQQNVTCSVLLNNGSVATSQAGFTVQRPTAAISASITGTIAADMNYPLSPATGLPYLHFGNASEEPGMTFASSYALPPGFSGATFWVQTGNVSVSKTVTGDGTVSCSASGLDTYYPYPSQTSTTTADSPGVILRTNSLYTTISDSFDMWLMFQPDYTNSIPVPLRKVHWGWSAAVSGTNGVWGNPSATYPTGLSDADTTVHPTWTTNLALVILGQCPNF